MVSLHSGRQNHHRGGRSGRGQGHAFSLFGSRRSQRCASALAGRAVPAPAPVILQSAGDGAGTLSNRGGNGREPISPVSSLLTRENSPSPSPKAA